ncbi:SDR family oxidoreductase [Vibrio sp. RM-69-4]|uniref:SDR family oxidoreductase n=1 Tax=Vibrio sp. RM-69-4 TaxID=2950157 RepID=UPI00215C1D25|nr:SDR family oxidoreductase [Vibrio sp. RM-69-4]MCR9423301.1 SDR family oxidoreductase [Vibrio sp. RM-69-4]
MDLNHQHVLLTGASGGIGQRIALLLAKQGASLVLVARDGQKLEQLRQTLPMPEKHLILSADLSTESGIEQINTFIQRFFMGQKRISVVINNAGINQFRLLARRTAVSVQQELHLNLLTPMQLTQSAIHWLNKPGIILNIGSSLGAIGYPGYATYCATKAGLHRFSEAMQRELEGTGIKVLYLAPRATNTELNNDTVNQFNQAVGNHCDEPEVVAQHVLSMLESESTTRWIGWPEKVLVRLNQLWPAVISSAIKKQQATILAFLNR